MFFCNCTCACWTGLSNQICQQCLFCQRFEIVQLHMCLFFNFVKSDMSTVLVLFECHQFKPSTRLGWTGSGWKHFPVLVQTMNPCQSPCQSPWQSPCRTMNPWKSHRWWCRFQDCFRTMMIRKVALPDNAVPRTAFTVYRQSVPLSCGSGKLCKAPFQMMT